MTIELTERWKQEQQQQQKIKEKLLSKSRDTELKQKFFAYTLSIITRTHTITMHS